MPANAKKLYGDQLANRLTASAARYREIADAFDRLAGDVRQIGTLGTSDAAAIASRAVKEAMWLAANANLDSVVTAAADYDRNVPGAGGAR